MQNVRRGGGGGNNDLELAVDAPDTVNNKSSNNCLSETHDFKQSRYFSF